jgi:hypothetical protein
MRDVQEDHQMRTTIEMAHEVYGEHTFWNEAQLLRLKAFAELVRADEREQGQKRFDAVTAQPAVPDAFGTREGEHPEYIQGWNDCRAEMLKGRA